MKMNKIILVLMILLTVNSVVAFDWNAWKAGQTTQKGLSDKALPPIDNCYNLTLTVNQKEGKDSKAYFKDCTDLGDDEWFCDCSNTNGEYTLTMQTDSAEVDDDRLYQINLKYVYYELGRGKGVVSVIDEGNDFSVSGDDLSKLGRIIEEKEVIVYVNNTIEVPVDVPRDVLRYVEVNVSVENTTKIEAAQLETNHYRYKNAWLTVLSVILVIACIILVVKCYWRKKEDDA